MKLYLGVTDNKWFHFLAGRQPDEVNFWRPGGGHSFRVIPTGGLFLFKLKSPERFIAGGGFLVRHSTLPLSLAWEAFGEKNGAPDLETLAGMIRRLRRDSARDPIIGCTILAEPFFLPREMWIPEPEGWSGNIVQGKGFSTEEIAGRRLLKQVQDRLRMLRKVAPDAPGNRAADFDDIDSRYGEAYLTRGRLGQGAFRVLVTESYDRRCAITGERTLPVLEAAHIKPYAKQGPHRVNNGLLLRSDLHTLFDRGYITVTPDHRVLVSQRIREEYGNGRDYYALHGEALKVVPGTPVEKPAEDYLRWHNDNVFAA